jgi:hypothetical protein
MIAWFRLCTEATMHVSEVGRSTLTPRIQTLLSVPTVHVVEIRPLT